MWHNTIKNLTWIKDNLCKAQYNKKLMWIKDNLCAANIIDQRLMINKTFAADKIT